MPTRYTHYARLDHGGFLDELFDKQPKVIGPGCPGGPLVLYGHFNGQPIRVDECSDHSTWVYGRGQEEADDLAQRMREKVDGLAQKTRSMAAK